MKVEVKNAEKSQKELSIEIPVEKYNEAFEAEYRKIAPTVNIPGFRKGKAPKSVVLKQFKHRISVNALEKVINESIVQALSEHKINPLNSPDVRDVNFEEGEPITFKVYVDVFPEYDVEKYEGYEFVKEKDEVADEDVDKVLEKLRMQNISYEPADDAEVQDGDMVVIDFEGFIDGEPFDGGSAKDYSFVVGSKTLLEEFEKGIIGHKKGDEFEVEVTFPEDYFEKSLAGKKAVFKISVKEVKRKVEPELNDDFAKDVDEECETLEDLKAKVRKDLEEETEQIAKENLYDKIIEKLIEENPFDVPDTLVRDQAERLATQTLQQYQYMYGVNPDQLGLNKDKLIEEYWNLAEKQIKSALILNKIAEKEKIEVTDEEVDKKIEELANKLKRNVDEYKKELERFGGINNLKNNILTDKIFEFLFSKNKIEEKIITKEEREKMNKEKEENKNQPEESKGE
ncbi:trigger factor [Deferribacter autotrophicus]|uniref:Trigger factor n=1 Tax=Deferribacter autotrophicus TaxID=500465 RepID=A0A5A8F3B9_9BACT|nr:trigger factor [Deferribacter autotrophicus]KAA0258635.1 trigger factor [Deferribacter autotrophicus]